MIRMEPFATVSDVKELWREMTEEETKRAEKLLGVVSDCLRVEADKVGKDLDAMIEQKPFLKSVAKSVTVECGCQDTYDFDRLGSRWRRSPNRRLATLGPGTYLVPGGALFIKKSELSRLGLEKTKDGR